MNAKVVPIKPLAKAYPRITTGITIVVDDDGTVLIRKQDAYSCVTMRCTRLELKRLNSLLENFFSYAK